MINKLEIPNQPKSSNSLFFYLNICIRIVKQIKTFIIKNTQKNHVQRSILEKHKTTTSISKTPAILTNLVCIYLPKKNDSKYKLFVQETFLQQSKWPFPNR